MTASSVKNADSILSKMAQIQSRMAQLKAATTRELAELNLEHEELRIELEGLYAPQPETLAGPQRGPRLATVTAHKPAPPTGWPGRPEDENLLVRAVGNLKAWCAMGTPRDPRPSYAAAKSWTSHGASTRRPIPRRWAEYFEKNHGIPPGYWPHGITEGHSEKARRRRQRRVALPGM